MKLTHVEVKNYRSLFHDYDNERSFEVTLGDGVNAITGPNNSGKSNILRALALALDADFEFNRRLDIPSVFPAWTKPVVTLTFQVPLKGAPSREKTLLKRLQEYELQVNPKLVPKRTYAARGEVRLRVAIEGGDEGRGERRRVFAARGAGARQLSYDDPVAIRALEQFDRCLQFVMVRSGESLESLLQGRFRDVLETILRDELKDEFDAAEKHRSAYVTALQQGVLESLRERISSELSDLFPEVDAVTLEPDVRGLEETLTSMRVSVTDKAVTDLADKGTGVRGGLIVAMLQHLAITSKRSIVFAVEEPESFLHPAAQEELRRDLEALAVRPDVSLLVTTHSPYIVSRQPHSRAFAISKDDEGRTVLECTANGDEPLNDALGGLFRNSLVLGFIERAAAAPDDAAGVLVVEGYTDRSWLQLAAYRSGRPGLVSDLAIIIAGEGIVEMGGGAALAVTQAFLQKATAGVPVAVLLDNDGPGQESLAVFQKVNAKTKDWGIGRFVFSYDMAIPNADKQFGYEAEDLWPDKLHEQFLATHGDDAIKAKMRRPKPYGGWHFDFVDAVKSDLDAHLQTHVAETDCARWVDLLEQIRKGMGLPEV